MAPAGTTISSFAYKLDPVGNRKRVTEVDGSVVTWAYDNTYQLLGERRFGSNSYAITYSYDPAGNRLTQRNSGTPTTYTYDAANELLTQSVATGRTTFSYDANGNQTLQTAPGSARTTWTWDFENRPTLVQLSTGIVDTFTYNADGQRVQKQDSTGTTNHIWDLQNILEETNQSNVTQVIYTLQPAGYGNVLSQDRKGTVRFYLFDGLGSADRLAGPTGLVTDNYVYEAFGTIAFTHGPTINPFKFVGQLGYYYDVDLFQYYVRARYYDPPTARWLQRDPLLPGFGDEAPYLYIGNSPPQGTDPSGAAAFTLTCPDYKDPNSNNANPTIGVCGAYEWSVVFRLTGNNAMEHKSGYIIQHITSWKKAIQDCNCPPRTTNTTIAPFYEAFTIKKNQADSDYDPWTRFEVPGNTQAKAGDVTTAEAALYLISPQDLRFVYGFQEGDCTRECYKWNMAGWCADTLLKPLPPPDSNVVVHTATSSWVCCDGKRAKTGLQRSCK